MGERKVTVWSAVTADVRLKGTIRVVDYDGNVEDLDVSAFSQKGVKTEGRYQMFDDDRYEIVFSVPIAIKSHEA